MTDTTRQGRSARAVTVGLVALYVAVSLLAAACPAPPAWSIHGHHHHGPAPAGMGLHTLLCAWSCQASPSVGAASTTQVNQPVFVLVAVVLLLGLLVAFSRGRRLPARAPPVPLSLR